MHVRAVLPTVCLSASLLVLVAATVAATAAVAEPGPAPGLSYQSLAAAGSDLLCGIRADDSLDCWGRSRIAVAEHPEGAFSAVSAARRAACGLRLDLTMECWGRWYSDADHQSRVVAPAGTYWKVDLAEEQACAIDTEHAIVCFGRFDESTPGRGMTPVEGTFLDVAAVHDDFGGCGIRSDGTIACWGDDTWGQASPPAGTFTDVAAGRMTVCAIRSSGQIVCWGRGLYGAADPPQGRFTALAIGGDTGCAIRAEGESLACWGADLGPLPEVPTAALAIGDTIAGLIGTNGVVHTWGETNWWRKWGGFDDLGRRDGFGAFRILGRPPQTLALGGTVAVELTTTEIRPMPEFRLLSGELPPGLQLTPQGRLEGIAAAAGEYGPITIVADNGKAPAAHLTFTLTVKPSDDGWEETMAWAQAGVRGR